MIQEETSYSIFTKEGLLMDLSGLDAALSVINGYDSSSAVSSGSLAYAVGVTMLDQNMELNEALNTQLIREMEQSVTPYLGGNIDVYA
jgi:hypothetical protein